MERKPQFMWLFRVLLGVMLLLLAAWIVIKSLTYSANNKLTKATEEATTAQQKLKEITSQDQYQKIAFAQKLYQTSKDLPWSDHIRTLIDILQEIQAIDQWGDRLELYDFQVNLDTIEISGKASSLALLYRPKKWGKEWLISKVSTLPFLDDIRIQSYQKEDEDNLYEFTLYATILLDETTTK